MPQMISFGNEMIRINSPKNHIEYSTNRHKKNFVSLLIMAMER